MGDEVLVRVVDRGRDLAEQLQPGADREGQALAPAVDRLARHVLHDEVRPAVGRCPGIVETGDAGVLEAPQDVLLETEAAQHVVGVEAAADELHRHALVELAVGAHREVDLPHAAAANPSCLSQAATVISLPAVSSFGIGMFWLICVLHFFCNGGGAPPSPPLALSMSSYGGRAEAPTARRRAPAAN